MMSDTEKRYRGLLRKQERSGLSVCEFGRRHGVPSSNLYWWRKRLRESSEGGMVPVRVIEDPVSEAAHRSGGDDGFELALSDGLVLRIPTGFDESDLRRLLEVLARPC